MKTIRVVVSDEGEIKMEAIGYVGAECEQETAPLERALGIAGQRTLKPERLQGQQAQAKARQQ